MRWKHDVSVGFDVTVKLEQFMLWDSALHTSFDALLYLVVTQRLACGTQTTGRRTGNCGRAPMIVGCWVFK